MEDRAKINRSDVIQALSEWVIKVSKKATASDIEIETMPKVVDAISTLISVDRRYY